MSRLFLREFFADKINVADNNIYGSSTRQNYAGNSEPFKNIAGVVLLCGMTLLVAPFSAFILSQPANAATISLSVSDSITATAMPSSGNNTFTSDTNTTNIKVKTDNISGYTLSLKSNSSTAPALNGSGSNKINSISEQKATIESFSNGTWGYKPTKKINGIWSPLTVTQGDITYASGHYLPGPTSVGDILDITDAANTTDNEYNLAIATKIGSETAIGSYSNAFIVTAVTNEVPVPFYDTFDEAFAANGKQKVSVGGGSYYKMQDMTMVICGSVGNWDVDTNAPTTQLVDTRDNKIYYVSKLKDGNCWMTQNLDLGDNGMADMALTPADSDIATNFTLTAPGSLDFSDANYDVINYRDPGEQYYVSSGTTADDTSYTSKSACESAKGAELCAHSHTGNYYNWYTATAGAGTQATSTYGEEATSSICPAGWRLPTNSATAGAKSYYNLLHNYDIISSGTNYTTNGFNNIRSNSLYFVRSGHYFSSSLDYAGDYGFYWSSFTDSNVGAYGFNFSSSYIDPRNYAHKYNGHSVRCLARNTTVSLVVAYDKNTTDPVSNMPANQLLSNYDGEGTSFKASSQVPTRNGYTFIGWATSKNGNPEYQAGAGVVRYYSTSELYVFAGTIKLYAIWEKNIYVSYNDNGGSGGPGNNVSAGRPTTGLTLSTTQPTRSGYYFDGWSLNQTAEWADYRAGATFTTADIPDGSTLYAVWKSTPYTIIYNDNGGSAGPGTITYDSYTVTISSTEPTASSTSSSFKGWSESSSPSSGPITAGSTYSFPLRTNSITLYAYYAACIIEGTPIILADGTTKPVEDLTGDEDLLAWDFETGSYVSRPIVFIDADSVNDYHVIYTTFSDGTRIGNVSEHGYFDLDLGKFIYIDGNNPEQYIGHHFVKQDGDGWTTVTLDNIERKVEHLATYGLNTYGTINFYVDGMLSIEGGIKGMFNYFDVDTTTMAYDPAKKAADLATYGEFTYDDFKDVISELGYEAFNGRYLKVSIGKGLITWDGIKELADRYNPLIGDD